MKNKEKVSVQYLTYKDYSPKVNKNKKYKGDLIDLSNKQINYYLYV